MSVAGELPRGCALRSSLTTEEPCLFTCVRNGCSRECSVRLSVKLVLPQDTNEGSGGSDPHRTWCVLPALGQGGNVGAKAAVSMTLCKATAWTGLWGSPYGDYKTESEIHYYNMIKK